MLIDTSLAPSPRTIVVLWLAIAAALLAAGCSDDETAADSGSGKPDAAARDVRTTEDGAGDAQTTRRVSLFSNVVIHGAKGKPNRQKAEAQLDLPKGTYQRATLTVVLKTGCQLPRSFPYNDACDPYDRLLTVTADSSTRGTPLELLRAITPFGGNMTYEADVTDYTGWLAGKRTVTIKITTYADPKGKVAGKDAQWKVSAHIDYEKGTPKREVVSVVPLYFHSHTKAKVVEPKRITVPSGATAARLRLRTTGHGTPGCDEFCKKRHRVWVNGLTKLDVKPWRECKSLCKPDATKTYCKENPYGAVQSVLAPRANWCPGHATKPISIDVSDLKASGDGGPLPPVDAGPDGGSGDAGRADGSMRDAAAAADSAAAPDTAAAGPPGSQLNVVYGIDNVAVRFQVGLDLVFYR